MKTGPKPLVSHIALAMNALKNEGMGQEQIQNFLRGIQKYQSMPSPVFDRPGNFVASFGPASLIKFSCEKADKKKINPVLIIPSLVNRWTVFDLLPQQSFARYFAQNRDVYIIDWGELGIASSVANFEDLYNIIIKPCHDFIYEGGGPKPHILGYCMGGTIAAGYAALYKKNIQSLILVAAPWDFHAGEDGLTQRVAFWRESGLSVIAARGFLPGSWLQNIFASLDPLQTAQKFIDFATSGSDEQKNNLFIAVEDWANQNTSLPGDIAKICILNWFRDNEPANIKWCIGGTAVDPSMIECPTMHVVSKNDRLVPFESSIPLAKKINGSQLIDAACGHIGHMASQRVKENIWPEIESFMLRVE